MIVGNVPIRVTVMAQQQRSTVWVVVVIIARNAVKVVREVMPDNMQIQEPRGGNGGGVSAKKYATHAQIHACHCSPREA